jgi:glyoxylase-like metal-dependent hydrolase (beta-lactamase superfamily II)
MQVLPNVHQIPINYKGRPLQLYLLRFGTDALLMDCGETTTPANDIFPYLATLGMKPADITHVLITHPDTDHCGGIHTLAAACPNAKFFCGTDDRKQIETPEGFARGRMQLFTHWHGMGLPDDKFQSMVDRMGGSGKKVTMTQTFSGGENLRIGDRDLRILRLPGHSMGHLGVFLPWENAAIIGDAVHHRGNYYLDGTTAFAVTYLWVDCYLGTIDQLEAMKLGKLFSCHWPNWTDNASLTRWLHESRDYAHMAERVILEAVKSAGTAGITLKELCTKAKPGLGQWDPQYDSYSGNMLIGHLQRLRDRGWVRTDSTALPARYIYENDWHGIL